MSLPLTLLLVGALAAIPPAKQEPDALRAETVADEAMKATKGICKALQAGDPEAALGSLAKGFQATKAPGAKAPKVDGKGFIAALDAHLGTLPLVRRCTLKPFKFVTSADHAQAEATLLFFLAGLTPQGERRSEFGDAQATFVREEGVLRLKSIQFEPRRRSASRVPFFTDVTAAVGLPTNFADEEVDGSIEVGAGFERGGLAVVDMDGDGDLDLHVGRDGKDLIFQNDGKGHFTDVADAWGLGTPGNTRGIAWVDLDGDGDLDLVLARTRMERDPRPGGGIQAFRNDGPGKFTDVTRESGLGQLGWWRNVAVVDVDGDGRLDLFVGQSSDHTTGYHPFNSHTGQPNLLFHNLGGFRFEEIGKAAGIAGEEWTLAAQFADLDGDGRSDLVVINDFGTPSLFHNESTPGHVVMKDVTAKSGVVDPGNGMGISVDDFDGDGRPDLSISKMFSKAGNRLLSQTARASKESVLLAKYGARGNSLWKNLGDMHFKEVGEEAGIRRAGWAWSCEGADVDDDGDDDLYVASGFHTGPIEDDL